jgi:hypothetical protein
VLRRISLPTREEVTGGWRRLHNEELRNLYISSNITTLIESMYMRCVGHVARMEKMRNAYEILVGKPEEKKPLCRPIRRREGDIRMYLREMG